MAVKKNKQKPVHEFSVGDEVTVAPSTNLGVRESAKVQGVGADGKTVVVVYLTGRSTGETTIVPVHAIKAKTKATTSTSKVSLKAVEEASDPAPKEIPNPALAEEDEMDEEEPGDEIVDEELEEPTPEAIGIKTRVFTLYQGAVVIYTRSGPTNRKYAVRMAVVVPYPSRKQLHARAVGTLSKFGWVPARHTKAFNLQHVRILAMFYDQDQWSVLPDPMQDLIQGGLEKALRLAAEYDSSKAEREAAEEEEAREKALEEMVERRAREMLSKESGLIERIRADAKRAADEEATAVLNSLREEVAAQLRNELAEQIREEVRREVIDRLLGKKD